MTLIQPSARVLPTRSCRLRENMILRQPDTAASQILVVLSAPCASGTFYVANHYVDALSGPNGLEKVEYLAAHWPDPEAIHWDILSDVDLERLAK